MPRFNTFKERNELLQRFDRLPRQHREMVINKHMGAMSVVMQDEKYWKILEKFIALEESMQGELFQPLAELVASVVDKHIPKKLDKAMPTR